MCIHVYLCVCTWMLEETRRGHWFPWTQRDMSSHGPYDIGTVVSSARAANNLTTETSLLRDVTALRTHTE